jgi:hypothetical protein
MIKITEFSEEVRYKREAALALIGTNPRISTYREALRIVCDESVWQIAEEKVFTAPTREDHESAFFGASRAVPDYLRPTSEQISYLAKLATTSGETTVFRGRLTKSDASNLISHYLA